MFVGMIVLSGGVEPVIEFAMTDRAIPHVLFGICVGVLDGQRTHRLGVNEEEKDIHWQSIEGGLPVRAAG